MYAIKIELKLNNRERTLMAQHAGFARLVYNYGLYLYESIDHKQYKGGVDKKLGIIKKILTNYTKKQQKNAWMNQMSSRVYQHALTNLATAYKNYFKGLGDYPVMKRKKDKQSFTVDSSNGVVLLNTGKRIKIPTLGTFRLKEHLNARYVTQTFTISRTANKWYVSFSVDAQKIPPLFHEVVEPVGIDLGVNTFATLSDGNTFQAKECRRGKLPPANLRPKPMKKAKIRRVTCPPGTAGNNARRLGKEQWRNRNKQLGSRRQGIRASNNAKKFYQKLAKRHARIVNQRRDFLQKTTTEISQKYANIRIEDLNVQGMIANRKLSAAISDLGFYEFRRQLEYKAAIYGTTAIVS